MDLKGSSLIDPQWLRRYKFSSVVRDRIRSFLRDGLFCRRGEACKGRLYRAGRDLQKEEALELLLDLEFETRYLIELDVSVFLSGDDGLGGPIELGGLGVLPGRGRSGEGDQ